MRATDDRKIAREIAREIAAEIKLWRCEQGWTQAAFAKHAGLTQSALARLEAGSKLPTVRSLFNLARGFGADLSIKMLANNRGRPSKDLLDRLAAAMYDCGPSSSHHQRWHELKKHAARPMRGKDKYAIETSREIVAYRYREVRAILHALGRE
jgi:transcriptional regulator with XRE-family HTH domain